MALAGQGLRDVTRIAASDPGLWTQILAGNAPAVREVLADLVADLERVVGALDELSASDRRARAPAGTLARAIAAGNAGQARIPGKHGAAPTAYTTVRVLIPDEPGQLGRLFADIGDDRHQHRGVPPRPRARAAVRARRGRRRPRRRGRARPGPRGPGLAAARLSHH